MPTLDIFKNDAFSLQSLTDSIIALPFTPTRLQKLGWFSERGIATTSLSIESVNQVVKLIPAQPRGAPGVASKREKRKMVQLTAPHLPQRATVLADEVQGIRAFGSETDVESVQGVVNDHLVIHRANIDLTIEGHRMGAVNGTILDADGSILYDLYDLFNIVPNTFDMHLDVDTTDVRVEIVKALRQMEQELGGYAYTSVRVLCSPEFFDAFVGNEFVKDSWKRFQEGANLRGDLRAGFSYAGVIWEEYRSFIGAAPFIPAGEARMVPEGIMNLFSVTYVPADYMETVNTKGLPYYSRQEPMEMNKGVSLESQSNPIALCQRPRAIVHLFATAKP